MKEKDNKLEQLRQERDRLINLPLDGMTLGEALPSLKKLQDVELMIAQAERDLSLVSQDTNPCSPSTSPAKKKKSISELNLGRYVMTVLAAGLCLLALGIFVLSFWGSLPDIFKFLLIMAAGTILECFGFWRAKKPSMRTFFLGLAGLGSGTLFIVLVSGSLVWNIYGSYAASIGLLTWFILHVWLALHKKANIFYVIAYIGGLVTIWLASLSADRNISGELMLIFLLLTIVGLGEFSAWKSKSKGLVLANILFCLISFFLIRSNYEQGSIPGSWYEPKLLPWVMIALAALCLFEVRRLVPKNWKHAMQIEALATFIACIFVNICVNQVQILTDKTAPLVTTAIIVLCSVKSCSGYLPGAAVPSAIFLSMASWHICGCIGLFPALAAAIVAAIPGILEDKDKRTGVILFYLTAVLATILAPKLLLSALAVVALMVGLAIYGINTARKGMYFRKPLDLLIMAVLPGILLTALRDFSIYRQVMPVGTAIAGLIAYDYFVVRKIDEKNFDCPAHVLWASCMIVSYLLLVSGSDAPYRTSTGLLTWLIFHVWLALHKRANIFYVIAYIGGLVTIWLAILSADRNISGELMLVFLLLTTVGLGEFSAWKSKSKGLVLANMLFCLISFLLIRSNYGQGSFLYNWYNPKLLPWVMIALVTLCLFEVRWLVPENWKYALWIEALATFITCAFFNDCINQVQFLTDKTAPLVTTAIIVLCGVKSCSGYLPGAAVPSAIFLSIASWHICGCAGAFPALVAATVAAIPGMLADKDKRTGVVLFFLTAVFATVSDPKLLLSVLAIATLMVGLAVYSINTARKDIYFRKPMDLLIMAVLPGILLTALRDFSIYLQILPVGTAIAGLIAYDYFVARKIDRENSDRLAHVLWVSCMIAAYLLLVFRTHTPFGASEIIVAVNVALKIFCFIGLSVFRIERARDSKDQVSAVLSVMFTHLNLYWSVQAWSISYTWVIVSLVGLALSAALILCGFRWRCKPMRQTALICSILYVAKMAFVDIRLDDGIKAAGALLAAGLLCFGISFAYHKLSRRYAAIEDDPS